MAVPISISPPTSESNQQIELRLDKARVDHAAALLSAYELLQELHEGHILEIVKGSLGAGDAIITKLAMAAGSEEAINIVRNLMSMGRILSSIDPDVLHSLADQLTQKRPKEKVAPRVSLWAAIKGFGSSDSRRAILASSAFLQAFGRALATGKAKR